MVLRIYKLSRNIKFRQVASLYVSMVVGVFLSIAITVVNTRLLGPNTYGDFKYLQNLFTFTGLFVTFGLYTSGGRLIAQKKNDHKRGLIYGNLIVISIGIAILYNVLLLSFTVFNTGNFTDEMKSIVKMCMPLLIVFPFQLFLENALQGDNRIHQLSFFRILPKLLYIAVGVSILLTFGHASLSTVIPVHLISILLVFIFIVSKLEINLKPDLTVLKQLISENKSYGFPVYVGAISNVGTAQLAGLTIGIFIDNRSFGLFSLALAISYPLTMLPSVIGTVLFKDFANREYMPKNVTLITVLLSLASLVGFLLIVENVFLLLYSEDYIDAINLTYGIGFASIFRGLGDYFNKFLGSKGLGRQLMNGAFINGISNLFGNTVLVYFFGLPGAVATKIVSDLLYSSSMYYYYKKYVNG